MLFHVPIVLRLLGLYLPPLSFLLSANKFDSPSLSPSCLSGLSVFPYRASVLCLRLSHLGSCLTPNVSSLSLAVSPPLDIARERDEGEEIFRSTWQMCSSSAGREEQQRQQQQQREGEGGEAAVMADLYCRRAGCCTPIWESPIFLRNSGEDDWAGFFAPFCAPRRGPRHIRSFFYARAGAFSFFSQAPHMLGSCVYSSFGGVCRAHNRRWGYWWEILAREPPQQHVCSSSIISSSQPLSACSSSSFFFADALSQV